MSAFHRFRLLLPILFILGLSACVVDACYDEFGFEVACYDDGYYYDDPYYDDGYYDDGYYDDPYYDDYYGDDYYDDYYDDYDSYDGDTGPTSGQIRVPDDFSTIQAAIDYALAGETVFVSNGTYSPSTNGENFPLYLKDGVSLKGQDPVLTILDAENADYLLEVFNYDTGTVSNLTLTGGNSDLGGAIYAENSSGRLRNLYVIGNQADEAGSAIYVKNSDGLDLNNLVIAENGSGSASGQPAQVEIDNSDVTFINNVVARGDDDGVRLRNGADGLFENNIFFDNGTGSLGVGLADLNATTNAHIRYSISFGNSEADYYLNGSNRTTTQLNDLDDEDPIKENFSADPLFQNFTTYTLQGASPAVNAGNPSSAANDRNGTRNDIGAYGGPNTNLP